MAAKIAPSATVDARAQLADDVEIGPGCVVGPQVQIGAGTVLTNNVTLTGIVIIGEGNRLFPNVVIGAEPQDLSYQGSATSVRIGDHNVIREGVTINRGTEKEEGVTSLGSHCYLMANAHVAHDCRIGDRAILCNGALLGGHVRVQDCVTLSGNVAVHHFVTVGSFSFVGGLSRVQHDVPPYMLLEGAPARPRCVNIVGLKRNDFHPDTISALTETFKLLYRSRVGVDHAREILRGHGRLIPQVNLLLSFVQEQTEGRHGRARDKRRAA